MPKTALILQAMATNAITLTLQKAEQEIFPTKHLKALIQFQLQMKKIKQLIKKAHLNLAHTNFQLQFQNRTTLPVISRKKFMYREF